MMIPMKMFNTYTMYTLTYSRTTEGPSTDDPFVNGESLF